MGILSGIFRHFLNNSVYLISVKGINRMPDGQYIQIGIIKNTFTVGLVTHAICVHQVTRNFLTANIQSLVSVKIKDQPSIEPELHFIETASVNGQHHPPLLQSSHNI